MASPTLLMHAAAWSQLVPPLAAAVQRGRIPPSHRWVAAGCLVSAAGDFGQLLLGARGINNLWLSYLLTPVMGAAFLWGLSWLQPGLVGRLALRIAVPGYLIVWYALAFTAEDLTTFSRFVYPVHSLLILAAALWTMIRRGLDPKEVPLLRADWFWIAGGLGLYAAATAAIEPLLAGMMQKRVDLVILAYQVRAGCYLLAFLAITLGILCPRPTTRSGPSSSPSPSA